MSPCHRVTTPCGPICISHLGDWHGHVAVQTTTNRIQLLAGAAIGDSVTDGGLTRHHAGGDALFSEPSFASEVGWRTWAKLFALLPSHVALAYPPSSERAHDSPVQPVVCSGTYGSSLRGPVQSMLAVLWTGMQRAALRGMSQTKRTNKQHGAQ